MTDNPVHVVIWSGGLDSTLILDRLCSSGDKNVWAFSINWHMINELKRKKEKEVRKNYIKYAKQQGYEFCHEEINVNASFGASSSGLPQAMFWFSVVPVYLPQNSVVYYGYHRGDDFWHYSQKAKELIKLSEEIGERKIQLQFPLEYMEKGDIIQEYQSRGIPQNCFWSCEDPGVIMGTIIPCEKCEPCITYQTALYRNKLIKRK